ncbi:hypothetical protein Tco_0683379 [Tanacetum coccineum]|uniref:Uncharacterized protein n=1 Tax=Tanacetum coccineum TaxID=301880 RepID=A0ABQ4XTT2_9ASTR
MSGSIRFDSFLPSVLLWLVIIVVVVGVGVGVTVVVIVAVVGAAIESWAYAFHQDKASSVRVPVANVTLFSSFPVFAIGFPVGPVFLLGLLVPAIVTACASRAAVTLLATYFLIAA